MQILVNNRVCLFVCPVPFLCYLLTICEVAAMKFGTEWGVIQINFPLHLPYVALASGDFIFPNAILLLFIFSARWSKHIVAFCSAQSNYLNLVAGDFILCHVSRALTASVV